MIDDAIPGGISGGIPGWTLTLTRNPRRKPGQSDLWRAESPGFLPGIGANRLEAKGSFFQANLRQLGCTRQIDMDETARPERLTWEAYNK